MTRKPAAPPPAETKFTPGAVLLVGGPADGRVVQATDRPVIQIHRRGQVLVYERDPSVPTTAVYREEAG